MQRASLLSVVLACTISAACAVDLDINTPEVPQTVTGQWEGSATTGFFEMVLAEDVEGRITGAGTLQRRGVSRAFEVTGANAFPEVSLTLKFGAEAVSDTLVGAEFVNYAAEFDEDDGEVDLVGHLNGGRLSDVLLRLERDD